MPVDPELLERAIERREELERVQDEAERARSSFHRAVRHLYVDGAPLREIAEALGLSHQRVHQIVGDADPVAAEQTDGDREQRACSFCGRPQKACSKLIAGPAVYICDLCISQVSQGATGDHFRLANDARTHCHFCGKKRRRVDWVVLAPDREGASICNECVALIEEILREDDGGAPVPART